MRKRCCKKRKTLPDYSREVLMKGRAETNSKEYLPFPVRSDFDLVGRDTERRAEGFTVLDPI